MSPTRKISQRSGSASWMMMKMKMKMMIKLCLQLVCLALILSSSSSSSSSSSRSSMAEAACSSAETTSLLAFKDGITSDPAGVLSNWSSTSTIDCCSWPGIACNASTGSISAIQLADSSLSGSLGFNSSSTSMPDLATLDLSNNNFSGPIPDELSGFASLSTLILRNNSFDGILPVSLISLSSTLTTLDVSSNQLSGEIPQAAPYTSFPASSYANNSGLCGSPLSTCQGY